MFLEMAVDRKWQKTLALKARDLWVWLHGLPRIRDWRVKQVLLVTVAVGLLLSVIMYLNSVKNPIICTNRQSAIVVGK